MKLSRLPAEDSSAAPCSSFFWVRLVKLTQCPTLKVHNCLKQQVILMPVFRQGSKE